MTLIKISDLTTADINLSISADSFLNELQKTATTQIFGGSKGCYSYKKDECYYEEEECNYSYKKDYGYSYKEECNYDYKKKYNHKYDGGWKKDC